MYRSLTSHVPPPIRGRAQAPSPGSLFRCAGAIPRPRIANPNRASKETPVPRIIVTTDTPTRTDDGSVLLDELVQSVHLSTGHAAAQLIERLAWAISDAEEAERRRSDLLPRSERR